MLGLKKWLDEQELLQAWIYVFRFQHAEGKIPENSQVWPHVCCGVEAGGPLGPPGRQPGSRFSAGSNKTELCVLPQPPCMYASTHMEHTHTHRGYFAWEKTKWGSLALQWECFLCHLKRENSPASPHPFKAVQPVVSISCLRPTLWYGDRSSLWGNMACQKLFYWVLFNWHVSPFPHAEHWACL